MMQGLQMAPPTPLPARPPIAMTPLTPVPLIPTPPASAILTPPASELPGGPHMLDAHLEAPEFAVRAELWRLWPWPLQVARLAQAWLERGRKDETGRPKKRARTRLDLRLCRVSAGNMRA